MDTSHMGRDTGDHGWGEGKEGKVRSEKILNVLWTCNIYIKSCKHDLKIVRRKKCGKWNYKWNYNVEGKGTKSNQLGMEAHTFNASTWDAESGGLPWIQVMGYIASSRSGWAI